MPASCSCYMSILDGQGRLAQSLSRNTLGHRMTLAKALNPASPQVREKKKDYLNPSVNPSSESFSWRESLPPHQPKPVSGAHFIHTRGVCMGGSAR